MWTVIASQISQAINKPFTIEHRKSVSGGYISQAYKIEGQGQSYFIKLNQASQLSMFQAEALALRQISATHTVIVPEVITLGISENQSYLVLNWLELGRDKRKSWKKMGRNLAKLHSCAVGDRFGWEENNTIGSTPQINHWSANWADFFADQRIGYQLDLANRQGENFSHTAKIVENVRTYLKDYNPIPSLLHGDLWYGNVAILETGEPVIFDPASYYGDRAVDIAMSELFGGFPQEFYQGYQEVFPLEKGFQERKILYNLYHVLNIFNLFGGSYLSQAHQMIQTLKLSN